MGARAGRDLLRERAAREALCAAAAAADALVLLGDVLELRQGPARDALAVAAEPLAALGDALAPGAPVTVVPGNHDHMLLAPWLAGRDGASSLGLDAAVPASDGTPLAAVVRLLGTERTTVAYPGTWVRSDVWATHGHYGDRHTTVPMLERLGSGAMARIVGEPAGGPARAEDYEATLGPLYAWLDAVAQSGGAAARRYGGGLTVDAWQALTDAETGQAAAGAGVSGIRAAGAAQAARALRAARRGATRAGFAATIAALNLARLGPVSADLSGASLRRAALAAVGDVIARLGVDAAYVISGHTHRAGPMPGDDPDEWRAPGGTRMVNCGCWVHQPALTGSDPSRSPYRGGFAVWVDGEPGRAPELVNLLD